ncbi:hypothetical protein LS70_000895 [Helicobacter sp. MIT 11-5569]|uniref:hypothetical protein n=1 Tax=Helicobacter sp. MIT 11-5569 TaxID=1548151 RepID=UPI00051FC6CE|nr:hypothetical protein [Helicobacter sp. MIT 11-5569]TLD85141.1 hypothetical protein LS70_000895 [Helicobacter sp. MIT 11-5569]
MRILAFFLLILTFFTFSSCSKPIANANFPYPKITYIQTKNPSIIPQDFANTLINRFKILYEEQPNLNLKELRFYFSDYTNDALEDFRIPASFSLVASYHLTLNAQAIYSNHTQDFVQSYTIPVGIFNPPYAHDFDGIILKILEE